MLTAYLLLLGTMPVVMMTQTASPHTGSLPPQTTLPIVFTHNVSARSAHPGDLVYAKTTQVVKLPNGDVIRAGSQVIGSVLEARPFAFDKTPYAEQQQAILTIHFDKVMVDGEPLSLNVYVRAIADTFATTAAREPLPNDDTLDTVRQVGGDQLRPSQTKVVTVDNRVVAYNRRDGVYAHLIANRGTPPARCDSTSVEESVDIFSASACGVYGFEGLSATELGSAGHPSTLSFVSKGRSPEIWHNSTALLEVLPSQETTAAN